MLLSALLRNNQTRYVTFLLLLTADLLTCLSGCSFFLDPVPVHVADPTSACERLRTSYPSKHGLILFEDPSSKIRSILWCFPRTAGMGVQGYNVNIHVTDPGTLTLVLSDIRPPMQFAAVSIAATCAGGEVGQRYVRLGYGTQWFMPVVPGDHCILLIKSGNEKDDVWFTLTITRP